MQGIDRFDLERFAVALRGRNAQHLGLVQGEHAFTIPAGLVAVHVRSSVDATGLAAECAENSIRAWLVNPTTGEPWGNKVLKYTTRRPGWERRLTELLAKLLAWAAWVRPCQCGQLPKLFVAKRGPSKGTPFLSCQCGRKCDIDDGPPPPMPASGPKIVQDERTTARPVQTSPAARGPATATAAAPPTVDRELEQARQHAAAAPCPHCREGRRFAFRAKSGRPENVGRVAVKCGGCGALDWLTPPAAAPRPAPQCRPVSASPPVVAPALAADRALPPLSADAELQAARAMAPPCRCGGPLAVDRVRNQNHPRYGFLFSKCADCGRLEPVELL